METEQHQTMALQGHQQYLCKKEDTEVSFFSMILNAPCYLQLTDTYITVLVLSLSDHMA